MDEGGAGGSPGCPVGFDDCNSDPSDGCETDLSITAPHCGACDHDCSPGACVASACQPFTVLDATSSPQVPLTNVALDATYAYVAVWTADPNQGPILRVELAPPHAWTWLYPQQGLGGYIADVVVSGTMLSWSQWLGPTGSEIHQGDTNGATTPMLLFSDPTNVEISGFYEEGPGQYVWVEYAFIYTPSDVFRNSTSLGQLPSAPVRGWDLLPTTGGYLVSAESSASIYFVPTNGVPPSTPLATPFSLGTAPNRHGGQLAMDGTYLYTASLATGEVLRVDTTNNTSIAAYTNETGANGIAIDNTHIYWTCFLSNGGSLRAVRK